MKRLICTGFVLGPLYGAEAAMRGNEHYKTWQPGKTGIFKKGKLK